MFILASIDWSMRLPVRLFASPFAAASCAASMAAVTFSPMALNLLYVVLLMPSNLARSFVMCDRLPSPWWWR